MIVDFVVEKMTAYIAGGMKPETAARFTTDELLAVYSGNHYSRERGGYATNAAAGKHSPGCGIEEMHGDHQPEIPKRLPRIGGDKASH